MSEPLTPERVENMLCRASQAWAFDGATLGSTSHKAMQDVEALATDWNRLHALHALSPADQQRVAEIRKRLGNYRLTLGEDALRLTYPGCSGCWRKLMPVPLSDEAHLIHEIGKHTQWAAWAKQHGENTMLHPHIRSLIDDMVYIKYLIEKHTGEKLLDATS